MVTLRSENRCGYPEDRWPLLKMRTPVNACRAPGVRPYDASRPNPQHRAWGSRHNCPTSAPRPIHNQRGSSWDPHTVQRQHQIVTTTITRPTSAYTPDPSPDEQPTFEDAPEHCPSNPRLTARGERHATQLLLVLGSYQWDPSVWLERLEPL